MYVKIGLNLSQFQKDKIKQAFQSKTGLTLTFNNHQLQGSDFLGLTKTQFNKINDAKAKGSGVTLKLSKLQISKQGGFIGTLLAGLAGSLLPSLLGGKGLVLPGSKGKGLMLPGTKRQGRSYRFDEPQILGKGLILGKNSPFKNVPILGLIL